MKKLRLLLLAITIVTVPMAKAQISFAVKGGVNLSNWYGESSKPFSPKIGFNAGIMTEYGLANNFCLQSGLTLHSKGMIIKYNGGSKTYNSIYLQLPVHAGYKVDISPAVKVMLHAGPYIAYGIAGKIRSNGVSQDLFDEHYRRFDTGAGLGVSAEYRSFLLDLGIDMGLLIFQETFKNLNSYLSVGYRF